MSRYYDPVTHRFLNADGYFQTGTGVLDTNMSAYCANNPVNFLDNTGQWAVSLGLGPSASLIWGISYQRAIAIDGEGNIAFQFTKTGHSFENLDVGVSCNASIGGTFSWLWDDSHNVYTFEKGMTCAGASGGPAWYIGADAIWLDEYTEPINGLSILGGVGVGADIHINRPETTTMAVYNIHTSELKVRGPITGKAYTFTSPKKKTTSKRAAKKQRTCRSCGRPIGSKPWECSGGWTY